MWLRRTWPRKIRLVVVLIRPTPSALPKNGGGLANRLLRRMQIPREDAPRFRNDLASSYRDLTAPWFRNEAAPWQRRFGPVLCR